MSSNTLLPTNYPANTRTVSGTVNAEQNDVILNCDTSAGAVTINLLRIPTTKWQQGWKLYVIDVSNNAATNNIIINAPIGFELDGNQQIKINKNGGAAIISIVSPTAYSSTAANTGGNFAKKILKANLFYVSPTQIDVLTLQNSLGNISISVTGLQQFNLICPNAFPTPNKLLILSGKPFGVSPAYPIGFSWTDINTLSCWVESGVASLGTSAGGLGTPIYIEVY